MISNFLSLSKNQAKV